VQRCRTCSTTTVARDHHVRTEAQVHRWQQVRKTDEHRRSTAAERMAQRPTAGQTAKERK
jgi:hypothetical protein